MKRTKNIEINWISYMFVIIITAFIVAIITENTILRRVMCVDGAIKMK